MIMKSYSVNSMSVSINQEATAVLHLHEAVKPTTYQTIIDAAKELFAEGYIHLVVDLTYVPRLNLTTLFTLYSLAAIANGQPPAAPEDGWNALHEMENKLAGQTVTNLNLCGPQPQVALTLKQGGLTDIVAMWPTLSMALKAFSSPTAKPVYTPIHPKPAWQTAVVH
jgi:anti-anti-sigma regulatory factor